MAFPQSSFSVRDGLLTVETALPTQGNTVNSASIDLGFSNPALVGSMCDVNMSAPDGATLATGQTLTFTIQDSADNSSFANLAGVSGYAVTGVSNLVPAGSNRSIRLPPYVRRYIRLVCVAGASANTSASASYTMALLT